MAAALHVPVPLMTLARPRPRPVLIPPAGLSGLGTVQVLDAGTTATIAGVIQQQEGYYPGTLAYKNNNPGNLIYAGQTGATQGAGGFAKFSSYQDGLNALNNQLQLYAGRGLTISDMMNVYAPATQAGNNPTLYASRIAGALGVSPDTRLLDLTGSPASSSPGDLVGTNVYSDAGLVPLDSLLPAGLDPVMVGVGAGVLGLVLYAAFGD